MIAGLHGQCVIVAVTTSPAFRLTSSPRPAGVRQVNHMRHKYLAAVLRQDVGYFDTTATSGAAAGTGAVAGMDGFCAVPCTAIVRFTGLCVSSANFVVVNDLSAHARLLPCRPLAAGPE